MNRIKILLVAQILILWGCQPNRQELIKSYFGARNDNDSIRLRQLLSEDFKYFYNDSIKTINEFIRMKNSDSDLKFKILSVRDEDSLVRVKYEYFSSLDSVLEVTPYRAVEAKFYLGHGKIEMLNTLSDQEVFNFYADDYAKKFTSLVYFLKDKNIIDSTITESGVKGILLKNASKFKSQSKEIREKYLKTSLLRGTYICKKCIYGKIEFMGLSTCLVSGFYGTSYVVDDNYVRISTDKGDLILKILDPLTLEGEGWASGTYKKVSW